MNQAVRQWVSACHKCLLRKRQVPLQTKYYIQPEAEAPMKRICIDIVGPLVKTRNGNTHIFTIYDPFSHWPSASIVQCLRKHIANHSVPSRVISDRGANLMSDEVSRFWKILEQESTKRHLTNHLRMEAWKISPLSNICDQPLH